MEPINYMALMPQLDLTQKFNQGLQTGQNIQQIQLQKLALDKKLFEPFIDLKLSRSEKIKRKQFLKQL